MKKIFLSILLLCCTSAILSAQSTKRALQFNINRSGLALNGYDPVSYFTASKPSEGKKEISYTREGITYRFASVNNQQAFMANPAKYEPQYGGWCAYAMGSSGEKVSVDPETFKIINGKLYLFYNSFFNNTLRSWNKNEQELRSKADENWKHFFN